MIGLRAALSWVLLWAGHGAGFGADPAGDPARGERAFSRCYACHSVTPGDANLQGPSLFRVVGRPAAADPRFDYSDAMKIQARSGVVWTAESLDRFLADPEAIVPGTAMSAPPIRDRGERADLIAYLSSLR